MISPFPSPPSALEYRELTVEEIATLKTVFDAVDSPQPDPQYCTYVGVVEGGQVVAFLVLQIKLHAEPMWIKEGHSQVFSRLVKAAEETVLRKCGPQWVYLHAPAGKVSQLASAAGMQLEPFCVYSKLVEPVIPTRVALELMSYPANSPIVSEEELEQYPTEEGVQ